ncbi:MAG: ATP-binding protein [Chlorobium sp.]|nr:ATP-binding protein [Chlorobium sp.]
MKKILILTLLGDLMYVKVASGIAGNVAEIFAHEARATSNIAEFAHAFELAISESFTNSVRYADPSNKEKEVTITFTTNKQELTIAVIDSNPQFNPHTLLPVISSYPEGGYGLFLINHLMDKVAYTRNEGKNTLLMTKKVAVAKPVHS